MSTRGSVLLALLAWPAVARADIAPTTYEGMTLAPIESTEVEMREERVRITCADVEPDPSLPEWERSPVACEVHAQFFMRNATSVPLSVYVGFPVGEYMLDRWKYDFRVEANGATIGDFERTTSRVKSMRGFESETEWFGWPHTFPVGDSTVDVRYRIQPSGQYYNHFTHNIYYVLHSGSFWKGPIGRGVVEIVFPRDVHPAQIDAHTTPGYSVLGRSVFWTFESLEPDVEDNIHLEIVPHEIFDRHWSLARNMRAEPSNHASKIELARALFPLSFHKGVTFYVPLSMTPEDYRATLALLEKDPEGLELFRQHFARGRECTWCSNPELSQEEADRHAEKYRNDYWLTEGLINGDYPTYRKLIAALARNGFLPPDRDAVSPYALRGAQLLHEVLAEDPNNAEAWFLYLSNYYRFKYSGYAPIYLAESPLQPRQIAVIERAHRLCPKHEGITLWYRLVQQHRKKSKSGWEKAVTRLQDYNDEHGTYDLPWQPDERVRMPRGFLGGRPLKKGEIIK